MLNQGHPSRGAFESCTVTYFKAEQILSPLKTFPLHFSTPFFPAVCLCLSPQSANKLLRHHHRRPPWQCCLLLSAPQVKAVRPRRGREFKSTVYSRTFRESGHHHLAVFLHSWHFRQSTCVEKESKKKRATLFFPFFYWMFRETTQSIDVDLKLYLLSLELHDFLCGCRTPFRISHIFRGRSGFVTF